MGKQSREKQTRKLGQFSSQEKREFSETGLEKTCVFIIKWGTYLSLFTPLFISLQFFFPFVAPKTILFRILVEIILAAYLLLVVHTRKYRPRINAVFISLTIFLAIFILASVFGINFSRSFWSTNERMTGVFTMLHLYALFIVLVSVFKKREDWEKFLGVSVIAGVLLSLYILRGSEFSTRGGGTIGNTSFMAAYLLFDVFFALILFLSNFLKKEGWPLFWQIFSGVSLLIILPVFLASTARGAIASFFSGLALLFLGYLLFSGKKILRKITLIFILLAVLSSVSLFFFKPTLAEEKIQVTIRDMKSRFVVWETGLNGFLERPILGWGPENFSIVFLRYFNSCMPLSECGNEVWFDRVHNIVFDTLVTIGIVGLISYLLVFFVAIYSLMGIISRLTERKNIFLPLGLIVILIVYFFQNLLVFDMINSYLVFFLTLSFVGFLTTEKKEELLPENKMKSPHPFWTSAIIVFAIIVLWAGNIKPLIANRYIIKMVSSAEARETLLFFQKSLDSLMDKYEAREQYAQKLTKSSNQLKDLSAGEKQVFSSVYGAGETEMEKSIQENNLDFRHHLFLGELYLASYRVLGNEEKIIRAEKILEKAIVLSPTNQQGYWELAEIKLAQGKIGEALPLLVKAVELEPRVGRSHWFLGLGYKIAGQYKSALEEVQKAKKNNYDWLQDAQQTQQVIEIINALSGGTMSIEDREELFDIHLKLIKEDPGNYLIWTSLATVYANFGQYDEARQAARKVIEIKPDSTQKINEFLDSLPQQ